MAESPLSVRVDDDTETIRVDSETGTIETDRPDGSVVVQLDARRPPKEGDEDKWFDNLADKIDPQQLATIATELIDAIGADDRSRQGYLTNAERGLSLLGTQLQEPKATVGDSSSAVDGMSTVTNPLLLEAVLKGWANAQAELLPASGPVKIKDDGEETSLEDEQADALERDMNHWFTTTAAEYYPDTSHMLLWGTYFKGSGFKKIYRCPMRRRPVSESVDAKDLIVSDTTKDFRSCARITHQIPMRPSVMKRMKFIGAYRDVALTQPTPTVNAVDTKIGSIQGTTTNKDRPEDQPYTVWESQCELDLDEFIPDGSDLKGEGIPLPYVVSLDKDSREILAIRRDWSENDPQAERLRMYVKYPYVPGPGFYGTGMLNILGNSSAAMTAAWREALDCGMFANFPGGLIAKSATRQNSSVIHVGPGEFGVVDTQNNPIQQSVMPLPYHDVTPGLMALMDKITGQSKEVGGVADIPAGEGLQNVPVGTMLANVEQATKIMAAAHKGMHTAQSEELQLLIDLFRAHPEDFWRSNKVCPKGYWNEEKLLAALDNCNLVPVSDPNVPSHIHRVAKALALVQLIAIPAFAPRMDPKETLLRCLRALREDPVGLVIDPPPNAGQQGDPAKLIKAQADLKNAETKATEAQIKGANVGVDAKVKLATQQSDERVAEMRLEGERIIHAHDREKDLLDHSLATTEQGLKAAKVGHEIALDHHEAGLARAGHEHDVVQGAHDRTMAEREHALNVHEVLHPPKPATPAKSKKP